MKECTLQEAVELCKKDGGYFYAKKAMYPVRYSLDSEGYIISNSDDGRLWDTAFKETWIYEPPKQSAFEKWNSEHGAVKMYKKEGWNAAIDEVLNKCLPGVFEDPEMFFRNKIKRTKGTIMETCPYCHRRYNKENGHGCPAAQQGDRYPEKEKQERPDGKIRVETQQEYFGVK